MRNLIKKSLAFVLVAALALTCFVGTFSVSAEDATSYNANISVTANPVTLGDTEATAVIDIDMVEENVGINEALINISSEIGAIKDVKLTASDVAGEIDYGTGEDVVPADCKGFYLSANSEKVDGESVMGSIASATITVTFAVADTVKEAGSYAITIDIPESKVIAATKDEVAVNFIYDNENPVSFTVNEEVVECPYEIYFSTTPGARVYEPWEMLLRIRIRDRKQPTSSNTISLTEFDDYGVYVLPSYRAEAGAEITKDYIISNGSKLASDNENMAIDGNYYTASYSGDLYTYMMGKDIYYLQYAVYGGVTYYNENYTTKTLENVLDSAYGKSSSDTEKALITSMKSLYTAIVAHRGDEYSETKKIDYPRVADTIFAPMATENNTGYSIATTPGVRVLEPWEALFRVRIRDSARNTIDLSTFEDYGVVLLKAKDAETVPTTAEEVMTNDAAYVMSKSNNLVSTGTDNYFTAYFSDELYAYQMQEQFYYVRYFVLDGQMVCSALATKSMYDVLLTGRSNSSSATEIAVIDALIDLYEKVTAHRGT